MKAMNTYLHIFIIQNWQNRLWFLKSFLSDTVNVGSVHAVLLKVRVYLEILMIYHGYYYSLAIP